MCIVYVKGIIRINKKIDVATYNNVLNASVDFINASSHI
jgi:hypothetical protein